MIQPDPNNDLKEFRFQDSSLKLVCQNSSADLDAAKEVLDETFRDMERQYELRWNCSPSMLSTNTWLLVGALNLAHRVVRLEQEANLQTRDLEEKLSKLLDDVPDDAISDKAATGFDRPMPVE